MKLPRDLSGERLVTSLGRVGYEVSRQTGSHVRLTCTARGPEHHITVPNHAVLKVGTLSAILSEVSVYLGLSRGEILELLFDR